MQNHSGEIFSRSARNEMAHDEGTGQNISSATAGASRVLWNLMESRGSHLSQLGLPGLIRLAQEQGVVVTEDVLAALRPLHGFNALRSTPSAIGKAVAALVRSMMPSLLAPTLLDPTAGTGGLVSEVARCLESPRAVAFELSREALEVAELLHPQARVEWHHAPAWDWLDENAEESPALEREQFDVVVANLPCGMGSVSRDFRGTIGTLHLRDKEEKLVAVAAARRLKPGGVAIFLAPCNFLSAQRADGITRFWDELGLRPEMALALEFGLLPEPLRGKWMLVALRRLEPGAPILAEPKLFTGEVSRDEERNEALLANFRAQKEGREVQLGAWVRAADFLSFEALRAKREFEQSAKRNGLQPIPLRQILVDQSPTSVRSARTALQGPDNARRNGPNAERSRLLPEEAFDELPNTIYLPKLGNSPVMTSVGQLQISPQNYLQIVLDPEAAHAPFVAGMLNTPLGQTWRESLMIGFINQIKRRHLLESSLYLVDTETQRETSHTADAISDLSQQLEAHRRALWQRPRQVAEIAKAVTKLNHEETIDDWFDSLPFPLASIGRTYAAAGEAEKKGSHLLHFFEAWSQWSATLLLSGFASDLSFCQSRGIELREHDPQWSEKYLRSDFGSWNQLLARLAKALRTLLNDKEGAKSARELFGGASTDFLKMLSDGEVFQTLDAVRKLRNDWKGHGGIEGAVESGRRLGILEEHLSKLYRLVSDTYEPISLVRPLAMAFESGVYETSVERFQGNSQPFKREKVDLLIPLDRKKLYLMPRDTLRPLPILPLVRMMASPTSQQNACYFYNKMDGDEVVRFVSYHFAEEADLRTEDKAIHLDTSTALSLIVGADPE